MKQLVLFLLLHLSLWSLLRAEPDVLSLTERLKLYKPASVEQTIGLLQKQNKGKFIPVADWEETIALLKERKEPLLAALKQGDGKAIEETGRLLGKLDALLLSNPLIEGKRLVAVKREIGTKDRTAMGEHLGLTPNNFQNNSEIPGRTSRWNNQMVSLVVSNHKTTEKPLYKTKKGVILSDPEPHTDGKRILFSSIGSNNKWHLFELDAATGKAKQVTPDTYQDFDSFDGCYTPEGNYIFCSTATFMGLPCTNGDNKMCGLFLYNPTNGQTRQLTFDQDSNWGPVVLNNGQILYQRWEYADIPHSNSRFLFSMNPDGTSQRNYYGSNSYFPTSFFGARPLPDHPTAVVGIATGHHSVSRSGRLMIIDPTKGRNEAEGVVQEIPYKGRKVRALERDRLPDGVFPQFATPYPLNSNFFLTAMKPSATSLWGIYLVDTNDNVTLIAQQESHCYLEPFLLEEQKTAPVIPSVVKMEEKTATIFMQDVYMGDGLKGIPRGTVKRLRIGSYNFSAWRLGGNLGTIGMDGPWDIKRILGTVEVETDGSAMFTVPANTPIFVQPLDEEGKALQQMRSWFTAMPGETQSCVGCHESKDLIPIPRMTLASKRAPQPIAPFNGRERGFSYRHEVQPILDRHCIACHDGRNDAIPYLKGDEWITDWSSQIAGSADPKVGGHFTRSYANLHRFVRRGGIESDMRMLVPMDLHADQTELMQILNKEHKGVNLSPQEIETLACWIDFNTPFHGRRSDIPTYEKSCESNELRIRYAPLLNAPVIDAEWLPEIPTNTFPIRPRPIETTKGLDSLSGWPLYDPQVTPMASRHKAYDRQIDLMHIREEIEIVPGVTLHLVKIPAGEFLMGSTVQTDEMPRSKTTISKPYWIGRFEITNAQFKALCPQHESRDEHRHGYQFGRRGYSMDHPDQPAVRLSWKEAMDFCRQLSQKTGRKFTLPTEAQWEWACRAGSDTPFWFGKMGTDFTRFANLGDVKLKEFAACTFHKFYESVLIIEQPNRYDDWIPRDTTYNDGGFISEQVGRYIPNCWDVADTHGNVWEWTLSQYKPYPYNDADGRNNETVENTKRVVRGGSWYDRPYRATSSYRLPYRDYQKVYNVGFRVVMTEED